MEGLDGKKKVVNVMIPIGIIETESVKIAPVVSKVRVVYHKAT